MTEQQPQKEQFGKIAAALAKAQRAFKTVPKNRVAKVPTKAGGQYTYKYADLSDVIEAVREALAANELCFIQSVEGETLHTMLFHSSGERLGNIVPLVGAGSMTGPQAVGSSLTYSRRYGLTALLGVVAEEDDDAQAAQHSAPRAKELPPRKDGKPAQADYPKANPNWEKELCTEPQRKKLWAMAKEAGYDEKTLKEAIMAATGKDSTKELTKSEIQALFAEFEQMGK